MIQMSESEIKRFDHRMTVARKKGALYHVTNPVNAYMCEDCRVFGHGDTCWCCGGNNLNMQYVPRFGGGAQTVTEDNYVEEEQ